MLRAALLLSVAVSASACGESSIDACAGEPCRHEGACTDVAGDAVCACAPGFDGERCELALWTTPAPTSDVDLLFVVDNSGSMQSEQARLVAAFGDLVAAMTAVGGVLPNLHVGVVSSNAGSAGQAGVPGCAGLGDDGDLQANVGTTDQHCPSLTDAFASDIVTASGRDTNYTGSLTDTFACLATLGTQGCGFEMHLESAWRALQPAKNPGFYRASAQLAVIVLADEDDCSTRDGTMFGDPSATLTSVLGPRTSFRCHEFGVVCDNDPTPRTFGEKSGCRPIDAPTYEFPIAKYVDFFTGLKADRRRLSVAGIVGTFDGRKLTVAQDPSPGAPVGYPAVQRSCGYEENNPDAGASPPVRLSAFLGAFGARGLQASACDASYGTSMQRLGTEIAVSMASITCIDRELVDDDPADGLQPRCAVVRSVAGVETPLPQCAAGQAPPCWNFGTDPGACPSAANALWVTPAAAPAPPLDGTIAVRCEAL